MGKNMIIDGIEYEPVQKEGDWSVIVGPRGVTFVGDIRVVKQLDHAALFEMRNVRNVIRWGTKNEHVGALANGPTDETILGVVVQYQRAMFNEYYMFPTKKEAWK